MRASGAAPRRGGLVAVAEKPPSSALMPYDEQLADRLRELVALEHGVSAKRMFGGLGFLVNGNLAVSASGQGGLLVRCDPAETAELLERPHAQRFEMRGRAMDGWLRVDPKGLATSDELEEWVARGLDYARSLPAKR